MWDKLEVFYHIVKAGTVSQAARELKIEQSSVSRKLSSLEDRLGYKLCHRTSRGIDPTLKGKEIFEAAESMYHALNFAHKKIEGQNGMKGKIRLCTTHAIVNYVLIDHLLAFKEMHPDIVFEIVCSDETVDLIANEVDIAIFPKLENVDEKYIQEPLFTLEPKLFCSQKYIDKYGLPKDKAELHNHKFIVYDPSGKYPYTNRLWFFNLNDKITEENITTVANSSEAIYQLCAAGQGLITSYDNMDAYKKFGLICLDNLASKKVIQTYLTILKSHKNILKIKKLSEFLNKNIKI